MLAMNNKPQATWLLLSLCVLGIGACTSDTAPPESDAAARAALERRIDAAAALTARLKAVQAVKRLQHAYGHYSEVGLWHDFADLFADNAVGHYTQGDLGKEEIRKLFVEQVGQGILGLADGRIYPHIALSPVHDVKTKPHQSLVAIVPAVEIAAIQTESREVRLVGVSQIA